MGYKEAPCLDSFFSTLFLAVLLLCHKLEISIWTRGVGRSYFQNHILSDQNAL